MDKLDIKGLIEDSHFKILLLGLSGITLGICFRFLTQITPYVTVTFSGISPILGLGFAGAFLAYTGVHFVSKFITNKKLKKCADKLSIADHNVGVENLKQAEIVTKKTQVENSVQKSSEVANYVFVKSDRGKLFIATESFVQIKKGRKFVLTESKDLHMLPLEEQNQLIQEYPEVAAKVLQKKFVNRKQI